MRLEGLLKTGRRFVIILGGRYVIVVVLWMGWDTEISVTCP